MFIFSYYCDYRLVRLVFMQILIDLENYSFNVNANRSVNYSFCLDKHPVIYYSISSSCILVTKICMNTKKLIMFFNYRNTGEFLCCSYHTFLYSLDYDVDYALLDYANEG